MPFPMLCLPREIRDQIYRYSLCAAKSVPTGPNKPRGLSEPEIFYQVPTPGLLRANEQIYRETIEIIYAKNTFEFDASDHLLTFARQIGPENCKQIKKILIWIVWPAEGMTIRVDSTYWQQPENDSVPSDWIAALAASGLGKVVNLTLEAGVIIPPRLFRSLRFAGRQGLQEFMAGFLGRMAEHEVPRLSLRGFQDKEKENFSPGLKVVLDYSDPLEDETEKMLWDQGEHFDDSPWVSNVDSFEQEEYSDNSPCMSDSDSSEPEENANDSH